MASRPFLEKIRHAVYVPARCNGRSISFSRSGAFGHRCGSGGVRHWSGRRLHDHSSHHGRNFWYAEPNGNPSELTLRRWQRFGSSGAKLIWGGEAVAVCHSGRANPNQVVAATHTEKGLEKLREGLIREHRKTTGSDRGLIIGVQLTHSGRYCR